MELLTTPLNADMSMTFSTWSNLDGREPSFPRSANCPAVSPSCEGAKASFSDVVFLTDGSSADPAPEPQPEPPTPESEFLDLTVTDMGSSTNMYVKGLDGKTLTTDGSSVTIGHDNRSFIFTVNDDSTV